MATYKVIQDIEAEDKFVGPLTLKQFVFAMGGMFFAWVCFFLVTKGLTWALIIFAPISLFGFFMAFPWSKEQPTDVWVLAKIRFHFKPKKHVWDQDGPRDLVTITAPKKPERVLTDNLSEKEVKSRLKALADTIDSRGWVVKHASLQEAVITPSDDRLVSPNVLPQQVPIENIADIPDMMDDTRVDAVMSQQDEIHKTKVVEKMDRVRRGELLENLDQPEILVAPPPDQQNSSSLIPPSTKKISQPPTNNTDRLDEMLLSNEIKAKKEASNKLYSRMSVLPTHKTPKAGKSTTDDDNDDQTNQKKAAGNEPKTGANKSISSVTEQISPDILNLARNNDLNVATIARQAGKEKSDDDEVVISLH